MTVNLQTDCGFECGCQSRLYHDVAYILSRYDAPIPRPTAAWIIGELQDAINTADEVEDDRIAEAGGVEDMAEANLPDRTQSALRHERYDEVPGSDDQ